MAMEMIDWAEDLRKELLPLALTKQEETWRRQSIYRVPAHLKSANIKAYEPQLVSIGPYHHGKPKLKPMEHHKRRALAKLIERSKIPIEDYAAALEEVVQQLMESYEQLDEDWKDPDRFLKMMMVDAGFIVELLLLLTRPESYSDMDPIFSSYGVLSSFASLIPDLLMVENQIPMVAVVRMLTVERGLSSYEEFEVIADFQAAKFFYAGYVPNPDMAKGLNLLDVFQQQMIPDPYANIPYSPDPDVLYRRQSVRSATKLHEAGVVFQKSETAFINDITFQNGVLKLPVFGIDHSCEVLFLNAMVYERLNPLVGHSIQTFIVFLFGLIDSVEDVTLLKAKGLIDSRIKNDQQVAELIKRLGNNMFFDPSSRLCSVRDRLNEYYEVNMKKWSRRLRDWRRKLLRTYFSSPWSFISLVAAAFLLVLTMMQTYYAAKAYYSSP